MVVELIGDDSDTLNATLESIQVTMDKSSCVQLDYLLQGESIELLIERKTSEDIAPVIIGSFFTVNYDDWDHGQFTLEPGNVVLQITAFGRNDDIVLLDNIMLQEEICNQSKIFQGIYT